jgi:hypothetical protein
VVASSVELDDVCRVLDPGGSNRPVLWVGAGLSVAAGCPSTGRLLEALRADTGGKLDIAGEFTEVVDAFVATEGKRALETVMATLFAKPQVPTPTHHALARLERSFPSLKPMSAARRSSSGKAGCVLSLRGSVGRPSWRRWKSPRRCCRRTISRPRW